MSLSWQTILAVGVGGFFGSILRAYAVHYSNKFYPLEFPVGVLFVNILGAFIIGALFAYFTSFEVSTSTKAFLTTGFLGGLTTFSTFAWDSYILFGTSLNLAILNIFLNLFGSLIATASGFKLIQFFLK
ncbi:fluoride efflux transporter CrcB [Aliarcobacter butzleri]|uniref:fluoride efflux transporter CrcB n=1 Tax=Aliarcobacter butzleri TaxID=28197 RepID=UPI0021B2C7BC|nr:fluoride efflux transporter CrcB [Aliarcobacter butzleri]MCT7600870.1 fluoride efflux transporter CrcB [Aliarcobacter butzleri]MCT7604898.1 fluoride efflux transporter CrcB [Aliarcobacter butzleri]MCT7607260.1 fluoride efflux transporter CrcB [Aliarcobacter butzleri]MDY0193629.1 fluoride efflux transporter CrcB [Aliarcobacter butzleri]